MHCHNTQKITGCVPQSVADGFHALVALCVVVRVLHADCGAWDCVLRVKSITLRGCNQITGCLEQHKQLANSKVHGQVSHDVSTLVMVGTYANRARGKCGASVSSVCRL